MDSLDGGAPHITPHCNIAIVAKASVAETKRWATERGWSNLTFLSSGGNSFNSDFRAENTEGRQLMALNRFRKTGDGIFHHWDFELFDALKDRNRDPAHPDRLWPFWTIYEVTLDSRAES